jgi:hypothetical protein
MGIEKQTKFIKTYKRRYGKAGKACFMDGGHPAYSNHAGYGRIAQGKEYGIRGRGGRERINLLGAYDVKSVGATVREYGRWTRKRR